MYLRLDSPAGVRFLALVAEGRGLKASARLAGIGKETGYRLLRESFWALLARGVDAEQAQRRLGLVTTRATSWERDFHAGRHLARHHRRVAVDVEREFWSSYLAGDSLDVARGHAGVSRPSAYRWLRRRYLELREQGASPTQARRQVRADRKTAGRWEAERRHRREKAVRRQAQAQRRAVRASARHVEAQLVPAKPTQAQRRKVERERRYWQLMRQGVSNTEACRLLGMSRRMGSWIRARNGHQIPPPERPNAVWSGRYLSLAERLRIADLRRLGCSIRTIAGELGRNPSTVSRELSRNSDDAGRYLPHTAEDAATQRRTRPRAPKLLARPRLRTLVQRKLNRCWSPEQICGWLRCRFADSAMRLCPETIYRALLVPGGQGLHKRYHARLRTGRKIRKPRRLTRSRQGPVVQYMTMIDQRPAEVEDKQEAGHWEGDMIVGVGSGSAMMTLRERTTQYGLIVNLPADHTAESVNAAAIDAFAGIPAHLKKTLTWDQGVEMARHQELAQATGIDIYFAERSSPWQRGANENFNGLARQYFPKGTDLSVHSTAHVNKVTRELNTRPRKGLDYRTPAEVFNAEARRRTNRTPHIDPARQ